MASHDIGSASNSMMVGLGQLINAGACLSMTVTVKVQLVWLPPASVTVQVTSVMPRGNSQLIPSFKSLVTLTTPQLSA